ncbi:hypothetical protein [Epibacterium sp. Ofav1-8]|uniref:hypothetical protein n=1 Tax=Epibacterium sp. Ofav1-8 TaxID=2917735 RepID=UPI001EF56EE9|nr:hypothetical protein [Epibacterium sp. Ofav1-8]
MVNESMKKAVKIYGKTAPGARMTKCAALLIATVLSIPTFVILTLIDFAFL